MWLVLALLSSVFAALTSILAKVGIAGVNSNLATAIRTAVVLVMAWGMVLLKVVPIDKLSVVITIVFAVIFLREAFTAKTVAGCILIGAGTLLMVL